MSYIWSLLKYNSIYINITLLLTYNGGQRNLLKKPQFFSDQFLIDVEKYLRYSGYLKPCWRIRCIFAKFNILKRGCHTSSSTSIVKHWTLTLQLALNSIVWFCALYFSQTTANTSDNKSFHLCNSFSSLLLLCASFFNLSEDHHIYIIFVFVENQDHTLFSSIAYDMKQPFDCRFPDITVGVSHCRQCEY